MSKNSNRKTVIGAISLVVFMGTLSFAAVPFYDWFCRVTGFGGTTQLAQSDNSEILDKVSKLCMDSCNPIDDKRGTVEYRTKVAGVLLKRTALIAIDRIKGN